jgi:hypothetical protein
MRKTGNILNIGLCLLTTAVIASCGGGGSSSSNVGLNSGNESSLNIRAVSPLDGATLKADFPISIVFTMPIESSSVTSSQVSLMFDGNAVAGSFRFSDDNTVVVFTPSANLIDGQTYTITLGTELANSLGQSLSEDFSWSFTAKSADSFDCILTAPPASLNLDDYYTQYCEANGLPILGGSEVSAAALKEAWYEVMHMMSMRQDLLQTMVDEGTRVAIIGTTEVITDIPEYADLDEDFPLEGESWDDRARGLGATPNIPVSSGAEENLLCDSVNDVYDGEDIFVHEFAHSVAIMGLENTDALFQTQLEATYVAAMALGRWESTYAATDSAEYWAEGVQSWFNVNQQPQVGIHNEVDTRAELKIYDPALHSLISTIFPSDFQPDCPAL